MDAIELQIKEKPITKEEAKEQFLNKTEELGIDHVYSFDEYWNMMEDYKKRQEFREKISEIQRYAMESDEFMKGDEMNEYNPVKHTFADGLYIREIFNPAGQILITKVHKKQHTFFLSKGKMSIVTEDGIKTIEAPYNGVTEAGTKRLIYTHTDCVFTTVHATELKDVKEIESTLVSDEYENDLLESDYIKELLINEVI
jgi:hypothetical protein